MDKAPNFFQLAIVGVFIAMAVVAVLVLATFSGNSGGTISGGMLDSAVVAGTMDELEVKTVFGEGGVNVASSKFDYIELDERTAYADVVEMIALGESPDLLIIDQASLYQYLDKIVFLPFTSFSEQNFRTTFVEAGEIFLQDDQIVAIPFMVDPLVLFWNRDMFANAGLSQPPAYWDDVLNLVPQLTRIDNNRNILKSTIPLGEARNITNSKAIISALMLQTGSKITDWDGKKLTARIKNEAATDEPSISSLRFYTDFANPSLKSYSWNRSLPEAREAFVAGDAALYIGHLSEASRLVELNPNLNYDIAELPQVRGTQRRTTYAKVYGLIVPKAAKNHNGAFNAAFAMIGQDAQLALAGAFNLPPVRRDLQALKQERAYWSIAYTSAIISRSWIEPSRGEADAVFTSMIENVLSGRTVPSEAISRAHGELANTLR